MASGFPDIRLATKLFRTLLVPVAIKRWLDTRSWIFLIFSHAVKKRRTRAFYFFTQRKLNAYACFSPARKEAPEVFTVFTEPIGILGFISMTCDAWEGVIFIAFSKYIFRFHVVKDLSSVDHKLIFVVLPGFMRFDCWGSLLGTGDMTNRRMGSQRGAWSLVRTETRNFLLFLCKKSAVMQNATFNSQQRGDRGSLNGFLAVKKGLPLFPTSGLLFLPLGDIELCNKCTGCHKFL